MWERYGVGSILVWAVLLYSRIGKYLGINRIMVWRSVMVLGSVVVLWEQG